MKARQRAIEYLRTQIQHRQSGDRLPSIARMAPIAGVGLVTMHQAVSELSQGGELTVIPGGGVFVRIDPLRGGGSFAMVSSPRSLRGCAWQRLTEAIDTDLLNGTFSSDEPLPSLKELGRRYGVSYPTLRKALAALVARGRIRSHGRGYRCCVPLAPLPGMTTLVVIAATDRKDILVGATPRSEAFWRTVEQVCHTRRLRLMVISYAKAIGREPYPDGSRCTLAQLCTRRSILGFLVLKLGPIPAELGAELLLSKHPACILDEVGGEAVEEVCSDGSLYRIVVGADRQSGVEMGHYLASLGHRSAVFFAPSHYRGNILSRAEGVREGLGVSGTLYRLTADTSDGVGGRCAKQMREMASAHELDRVRASVAGLRSMANTYASHALLQSLGWLQEDALVASLLKPVFEQALLLDGVTAWVGFNDRVALMARHFLYDCGIQVPDTLSVVGFDDTPAAFGSGLTSHNPNMAGVVNVVVDHLFECGHGAAFRPRSLPRVAGVITERESSGTLQYERNRPGAR